MDASSSNSSSINGLAVEICTNFLPVTSGHTEVGGHGRPDATMTLVAAALWLILTMASLAPVNLAGGLTDFDLLQLRNLQSGRTSAYQLESVECWNRESHWI